MAVVATLTKGYDLEYIWKQVDRGAVKDAASYYIQASESGGEPPGRWWGPGAKALGFEPGQRVDREPYDLLFGQRKAPDGTPLGRPPGNGRKAADLYAKLLAAEPNAAAERRRELRIEATKQARQSPLLLRSVGRNGRHLAHEQLHRLGRRQLRRSRQPRARPPRSHPRHQRPPRTSAGHQPPVLAELHREDQGSAPITLNPAGATEHQSP